MSILIFLLTWPTGVDWSIELLKFYSRPKDSYYLLSPESDLSLPFSVQALNSKLPRGRDMT